MSLKFSGLLFVLFIALEAINALALNNAPSEKSHTQELPTVHGISDKSHSEVGLTTESVKIIIPNASEIISNETKNTADDSKNTKTLSSTNATTTTTTTTTAATTTTTSTTTTTPAPTTTVLPPTPVPPAPEKGLWVVRNETSNMTCIIAGMAMQLNISYPLKSETMVNATVNVPKNATASGSCAEPSQSLVITWGPNHSLRINFSSNKTTKNFYISELALTVNATVFRKDQDTFWHFKNSSLEFATPLDMSYKCSKMQDINLKGENETIKAVLSLKDTQFEAFMNKSKAEFGAVQDCDTFDTPDIVPIAVGCALAILVLVVLVAYLIGRKRSQNQGYLSM